MSPARPPTPIEIAHAPELAILAALDDTLDLALRALVAAHPPLGDPDCPRWTQDLSPTRAAADRLLAAARPLTHALDAYRRAVARPRRRDPDPDPQPPTSEPPATCPDSFTSSCSPTFGVKIRTGVAAPYETPRPHLRVTHGNDQLRIGSRSPTRSLPLPRV